MRKFSTWKEVTLAYSLGLVSMFLSVYPDSRFFAYFAEIGMAFFVFGGMFAAIGKYPTEETKA